MSTLAPRAPNERRLWRVCRLWRVNGIPARLAGRARGASAFALGVGLALLVVGCGAAGKSASTPTLLVSPSTGLVGGQQVRVSLVHFPRHATILIYECARTRAAVALYKCAGGAASTLSTGSAGTASGQFVAQPSGPSGANGPSVPCRDRCVLVGEVIKAGARALTRPMALATERLSFSAMATSGGLGDAFLQSLSWVSPTDGWALAAQPCAAGTCARLEHTNDGGRSWEALPNPPAGVLDATYNCAGLACVTGLVFGSPAVGYLYGPGLLMTTDGGQSWRVQHGPQVETVTAWGGHVYRVAYYHTGCPGPCQPSLEEAPIGSSRWQTLIARLVTPGRSSAAQIVGSGSTLMTALYGSQAGPVSAQAVVYRSVDDGASWRRQGDPCSGRGPGGKREEEDLLDLAAAPGGFYAGLCAPHVGTGTFVITSADGGRAWKTDGSVPGLQGYALLAAASPRTIAVSTPATSGGGSDTARLLVSTDGGQRWSTAATDTQQVTVEGVPAWLGFQTPTVGTWVGDSHGIWNTFDGGSRWTRTALR